MKRFWRNIRGSKFWERGLALLMVLVVTATLIPMDLNLAKAAETASNLLDASTTVSTTDVKLSAKYLDENDSEQVVNFSKDETVNVPYDADIVMNLQFMLGDGNAVDGQTTYTYTLPDTVRVDVDAWHELTYQNSQSIGRVHIKKDGTLDFQFYENVIQGKTQIPFYVQFEGNFSSDINKENQEVEIEFPASDGTYSFSVITDPASQPEEEETETAVGVTKSGNVITGQDGKRYIKWNVNLQTNGRDSIDGEVVDVLPEGLTYVPGSASIVQNQWGNYGTVTGTTNGNQLKLALSGTGQQNIDIEFLTEFSNDALNNDGMIHNASTTINNTVVYNPEDTTDTSVADDGSVSITPNVVSKSAGSNKLVYDNATGTYYIDWTVVINADQLNIGNATYTDTLGSGLVMPEAGNITVLPNVATPSVSGDQFTITFPSGYSDTVTVTYRTYVDNASLKQSQFENTAKVSGGNLADEFSAVGRVTGVNYLDKSIGNASYDKITKTFRWTITVNQDKQPLNNVVVTDVFDTDEMIFVSTTGTLANGSDTANGNLVFELGNITDTQTIEVVTRINPNFDSPNQWHTYKNTANLTAEDVPTLTDTAEYNVDKNWETPDFLSKEGTMNGDGTITWTVKVTRISDSMESMSFQDVLPENMKYVEGSFNLREYYWEGNYAERTPQVTTDNNGIQTLKYEITPDTDAYYMQHEAGYAITYKTIVTDVDAATTSGDYTNEAKVTLNFENNITVEDEATETITGTPGGILDKTYTYNSGREVIWNVAINEARLDLNVDDPIIEDQLADYFDYVSGTLYLVNKDGTRSAVPTSDYFITTINKKVIVQLPDITNQCYEFEFKTRFNTTFASELDTQTINNSVTFGGRGKTYTDVSNTIQNVQFSSSSAGAVLNQEIRIKKVDSDDTTKPLAGAVFQLKLNGVVVGEAISGSDGYAVFKNMDTSSYGYTFDVIEITAPNGYKITEDIDPVEFFEEKLKTDSNGVRYIELEVKNELANRQTTGSVEILKVDSADNTTPLEGAVFGIYSDAACTTLVATMDETGADGKSNYAGLAPGTYYIKEISSPIGYKADSSRVVKAVLTQETLSVVTDYYETDDSEITGDVIYTNTKINGSLVLTKVDSEDDSIVLPGAEFGLYTDIMCNDRIQTGITAADGTVTFDNLEVGKTYYYREDKAPSGYVQNSAIYSVTIGTGEEHEDVIIRETVINRAALGTIVVTKYGDSGEKLAGVEFQLMMEDGTTAYDKNTNTGGIQPYIVTTDVNGVAKFEEIPFGTYKIKETQGLDNYIVSADTTVVVDSLDDKDVTIVNNAKKVTIRITKTETGDLSVKLSGAVFGLYTEGHLRVESATTNSEGVAEFTNVPYGNYYIKEESAPSGYISDDTEYPITTTDIDTAIETNNGIIERNIENEKQRGAILLKKVDGAGNPLSGAEYTLYNDLGLAVKTATSMTASEASSAGFDEGSIYFDELPFGTYYIQETKAPEAYVRDTGYYMVIVERNNMIVTEYYDTGANPKTDAFVNVKMNPPYISFRLKKTDDNGVALPGATFGFFKQGVDTPIATAVTDSEGIAYFQRIGMQDYDASDSFVVKEISAPAGYIMDETFKVEFPDKDSLNKFADPRDINSNDNLDPSEYEWLVDTEVNSTIENEMIRGSVSFTKYGMTNLEPLAGAEFTLYNEDGTEYDMDANVTGIQKYTVTTVANGVVRFENLPIGRYIIRETKTPKGYTIYETPISVTITDATEVVLPGVRNTRIYVTVSKRAVGGAAELSGAKLGLYATDGTTLLHEWTSGNTDYRIPYDALEVGKTYVLKELKAPNGYMYSQDVTFTIGEDGSIQQVTNGEISGSTVIMRDEPIQLSVSKVGSDTAGTELSNAILGLYDNGGTLLEQWTSGTKPHVIDCRNFEVPKGNDVNNVYTIRELSAPTGYLIADPITFVLKNDGNFYEYSNGQIGNVYTSDTIVITDEKKASGTFYFRKIDTATGLAIEGTEFEILNADGSSLTNANGVPIRLHWISTTTPYEIDATKFYVSDSINEYVYMLVEVNPAAGYDRAEPVYFKVVQEGYELKLQYVSGVSDAVNAARDTVTMKDRQISLTIRKQNEFGYNVVGATLKLSEYANNSIVNGGYTTTFTTDGSEVSIDPTKLAVGKSYILQEIYVPDGYLKADDIVFTIQEDASIMIDYTIQANGTRVPVNTLAPSNKIVMEDKSSGIVINKLDVAGDFVEGATLRLSSSTDRFFTDLEWTTTAESKVWDMAYFRLGQTYTLTEVSAPNGYTCAEPITIKVSNDGTKLIVNGREQNHKLVNMTDQSIQLNISKQDITNSKELAGAKLEIRDESGNLIHSFVSGDTPTNIPAELLSVPAPGEYKKFTLTEITAPYGYYVAETITFALDSKGVVYYVTQNALGNDVYNKVTDNMVIMYDAPKFSISKQDIAGAEVPGATITITTTEDDNFQTIEFVSGTVPKYFEDGTFTPGITYTLTETNAPDGYAYAESITFKFDTDGNLFINGKKSDGNQVVMVDNALAVMISKQDITNSKELAGAKLVIKNEAGEVIHSFVSTNTPTLLPHTLFVAPKPGEMSYYSLTELTAPDGYEIAETIYFALDSSGQVYVKGPDGTYQLMDDNIIVMFDQPTITSGTGISKTPLTGDQVRMKLAILLGMISLFSALVLIERSIFKK